MLSKETIFAGQGVTRNLKKTPKNMNNKLTVAIIAVSIVILVGGAYSLGKSGNSSSSTVASSSAQIGNTQIKLAETSYNLGYMKVSEEKHHDFIIKNIGKNTLQLSDIKSSCMCTAGQVIYKGQESEEFGMHGDGSFLGIAPGDEATIRVIYRPFQMPVYGPIEREVSMTTNDPANSQLVFKITANVN